jgi:RimJ/RimL family protein N-acetyltransferase
MFARTPRLLLRPGWAEDAPALTAAIADEAVVRNLARAPWPYGEEDARAFLASWADATMPRFVMVQRTAAQPRLIGCIGMEPDGTDAVELGYWVARPFWGLGYATEAGRHMIDLARTLGIGAIKASHFLDNPASGAVLRKLGFRPTGRVVMRASTGRASEAPTAEYVRQVEAPGNDPADGDGDDVGITAMRWPDSLRQDWRLTAA